MKEPGLGGFMLRSSGCGPQGSQVLIRQNSCPPFRECQPCDTQGSPTSQVLCLPCAPQGLCPVPRLSVSLHRSSTGSWRDGSSHKGTCCFCRWSKMGSQDPCWVDHNPL